MQFRRFVAWTLVFACLGGAEPGLLSAALAASTIPQASRAPQLAVAALTISGTVFRSDGTTPAGDVRLRLRNLDTGTIAGNTVSDNQGRFSFAASEPGRYMVEAAGKTGGVVAVSDPVTLAGSTVSTKVILPEDKQPATATTAAILLAVAGGLGLVGWIVGKDGTTSPER